ncbi:hypothetical protein [Ktedonospora formicarum]|nr:hypothetical protein [Ktedonospora formicarum]
MTIETGEVGNMLLDALRFGIGPEKWIFRNFRAQATTLIRKER